MSAEICYQEEQAEDVSLDQGLKGLPFHFFENWKEVSVLEFLNGCMPSSKAPQLRGPTSQAQAASKKCPHNAGASSHREPQPVHTSAVAARPTSSRGTGR